MTTSSWLRKLFSPKAPAFGPASNGKKKNRARLAVESLEDRCLLSGTPVAAGHELVVIDGAVPDQAALIGGVAPGTDVAVLDPNKDGVQQLADLLAGRSGLDAIYIVSHGSPGELLLGDTALTDGNLAAYTPELSVLRSALAPGGDLLLYGCDVAAGQTGQTFLTDLAHATGADVAASTDLTGSAALGGNWNLEWHSGPIEASLPFTAQALSAFQGTLLGVSAVAGQSTAITQPDPLFPNVNLSQAPTQGVIEVRATGSTDPWTPLAQGDLIHFSSQDVQYTANANASGSDSFTLSGRFTYDVTITTPSAPSITTQPQDQTVPYFSNTGADEGATMTVTATGSPTPTYQWYQGASGDISNPIAGATGASYHTPGLTQTTQYWVQVTNSLGTANSRTVTVTVDSQPRIIDQPNSPTVTYGESASLGVYAVGPGLKYQWFQGQPGDTSAPATAQQDTPDFDTPPLFQSATYWVRVSNASGSVDSEAASVTLDTAPKIVTQPGSPEVEKGQGTTLSVAAAGAPTLTYQWYQGASGDTSNPIAGATGSTFQTGALDVSTAFWVRVSNASGAADSQAADVAVIPVYDVVYQGWDSSQTLHTNPTDPSFILVPLGRVVIQDPFGLGGSSEFGLRVISSPSNGSGFILASPGETDPNLLSTAVFPTVDHNTTVASTLLAGDFVYGPTVGTTAHFDEFTISDGDPSDPNTITRTILIAIHYPPAIATQPTGSTIGSGNSTSLTLTVSGPEADQTPDMPMTYQIYQGETGDTSHPLGGPQSSDTLTTTLTTPVLTTTAASESMRLWVRASNPYGTADTDAVTVVVQGPPPITAEPQDSTVFVGQTASASVTATGSNLTYQWYTGDSGDTSHPIAGATGAVYTTPLQTTTTVWVRVSNGYAPTDSSSATLTVNPAPTITGQPQNASIFVGQSATLTATADGAALTYQWYRGSSGDTSHPITGATGESYTTPALSATATFWVRVTNPAGNADSGTVTVTVLASGVSLIGTHLYVVGGNTTSDNVEISPAGGSNNGSTGVQVRASLNGVKTTTTVKQAVTAVTIVGYAGNDNIQLANSLTVSASISAGNGNDNVQAGDGNIIVTLGNGNDNVNLGSGNDAVTLGNGADNVQLGDGNNVVVTGNGNDNIHAGNGDNLIAAGLGQHNVQVGNGSNILIDGSVALTGSSDSLRQVLTDWETYGATDADSLRSRLAVTDNSSHANHLHAGSGLDWFWETYARDSTNRKPTTDLLN